MALRGDENYVKIQGTLVRRTVKGVLIRTDAAEGWVARQCVHFTTDQAIDKADDGAEMEFRIMEWAANKEGLI